MAVSGGAIVTSTRMVAWTHMTIGQKTSLDGAELHKAALFEKSQHDHWADRAA